MGKPRGGKKRTSEDDMTSSRSGKQPQREAEAFFDLRTLPAMPFHQKRSVGQISNSPARGPTPIRSTAPIEDEDEDKDENKDQNKDAHDDDDNNGCYLDNNPTEVQAIPRSTAPALINSQLVVLSARSAPHQSSKAMSSNKQPLAKVTWKTFSNIDSQKYLSSATDLTKYHHRCRHFHTRLIIICCGFFVDELDNIFYATIPSFIHEEGPRSNRLQAFKCFYDAYDSMQDDLISKLHSYACSWVQTTVGNDYKTWFVNGK